jgi:uncharacterized paraquat-inducible protein A
MVQGLNLLLCLSREFRCVNELVRCKTCHYSLMGLTEHRCPECGTPFDPNDPSTFEIPRPNEATAWIALVAAFVLVFILLTFLVRMSIGRSSAW